MFGKKKAPLPEGIRLMHYEGLPGFAQDAPCFMEQTAEALVFRRVEGPSVTLPLAKVDSLDIMDERNFAAKYRGTSPNTSPHQCGQVVCSFHLWGQTCGRLVFGRQGKQRALCP